MRFTLWVLLLTSACQSTGFFTSEVEVLTAQTPLLSLDSSCSCKDILDTTPNKTYHLCNNATLGPQLLPWSLPLLSLVSNYDRFGDLPPLEFLQKWWDSEKQSWKYPLMDGFQLDINGVPINGSMILRKGLLVDRFGSEGGRYVSAADAPFSQRALPPDALNVCRPTDINCSPQDHPWAYHVYEVVQEFQVIGGPIAPGFEQPGGGIQFFTGCRIYELVNNGYLKPLRLSHVHPGPGSGGNCGKNPVNCTCERPK